MNAGFGAVMQHGYVVNEVAAAAAQWAERVGAGPFYVIDRMRLDQYWYRGVRTDVEMRLAFGYWAGLQIELIEPLGPADNLYGQALRDAPGKLNHCAVVVSDIDRLLAARSLGQDRVIQSGTMPSGLRFVYLDRYLPGGLHLELIEATESTLGAFAGMQAVSRQWDGQDPLRPIARVQQDLAGLGH